MLVTNKGGARRGNGEGGTPFLGGIARFRKRRADTGKGVAEEKKALLSHWLGEGIYSF